MHFCWLIAVNFLAIFCSTTSAMKGQGNEEAGKISYPTDFGQNDAPISYPIVEDFSRMYSSANPPNPFGNVGSSSSSVAAAGGGWADGNNAQYQHYEPVAQQQQQFKWNGYNNFVVHGTVLFPPPIRSIINAPDWFLPPPNEYKMHEGYSEECGDPNSNWAEETEVHVADVADSQLLAISVYKIYYKYQYQTKVQCAAQWHGQQRWRPAKFIRLFYRGLEEFFGPDGNPLSSAQYSLKWEAIKSQWEGWERQQSVTTSHWGAPTVGAGQSQANLMTNLVGAPPPAQSLPHHSSENLMAHLGPESLLAHLVGPPPSASKPNPKPQNQAQTMASSSSDYPLSQLSQSSAHIYLKPNDPFAIGEAFILNTNPYCINTRATEHFEAFLKSYKPPKTEHSAAENSIQNVYPLSYMQLQAGIGQQEMQQKMETAEYSQRALQGRLHEIIMQGREKFWNKFFEKVSNTSGRMFSSSTKILGVGNRSDILVETFKKANGLANTDSTDLIELLLTSTAAELKAMNCASIFGNEVNNYENYKAILRALCGRGWRFWDFGVNVEQAQHEIATLNNYYHAYKNKNQKELPKLEAALAQILGMNNHSQLRKTFQLYQKAFKREFYLHTGELYQEVKNKKPKDHFLQTVHSIAMDVGMGRPHFFAMLLAQKMDIIFGINLTDGDAHIDMQRILITRARIDLKEIVEAYDRIPYRTPLLQKLKDRRASKSERVKFYAEFVEEVMHGAYNL